MPNPIDKSKSSTAAAFAFSSSASGSACGGGGGWGWDSSVVVLLHLVLSTDDELSVVGFVEVMFSLEGGGVEFRKSMLEGPEAGAAAAAALRLSWRWV